MKVFIYKLSKATVLTVMGLSFFKAHLAEAEDLMPVGEPVIEMFETTGKAYISCHQGVDGARQQALGLCKSYGYEANENECSMVHAVERVGTLTDSKYKYSCRIKTAVKMQKWTLKTAPNEIIMKYNKPYNYSEKLFNLLAQFTKNSNSQITLNLKYKSNPDYGIFTFFTKVQGTLDLGTACVKVESDYQGDAIGYEVMKYLGGNISNENFAFSIQDLGNSGSFLGLTEPNERCFSAQVYIK